VLASNNKFQARSLNIPIKQDKRSLLEMLQNFIREKIKNWVAVKATQTNH
jgi:hypothetical protein